MSNTSVKREVITQAQGGLKITDILLIAVLLAAGAVLKSFSNIIVGFSPLKPNFVIAMYCLAIILIKPRFYESVIIGFLAGVLCQFLPNNTPYANLISEAVGGAVMALLIMVPMKLNIGRYSFKPAVTTFLSTLSSGFTFFFVLKLMILFGANLNAKAFATFMVIIFGTAAVNAIIVQILYAPLKLALGKKDI
ncbi:MAG: hypothetical protein BWY15_01161 [Firmicutes bacterium ADurb.Bin193]|nr:MAG: hypothetical protein BWY15_01161 [Firmicutes bacterium ADurb.Bin193]